MRENVIFFRFSEKVNVTMETIPYSYVGSIKGTNNLILKEKDFSFPKNVGFPLSYLRSHVRANDVQVFWQVL